MKLAYAKFKQKKTTVNNIVVMNNKTIQMMF